jgi:hypothetical protein
VYPARLRRNRRRRKEFHHKEAEFAEFLFLKFPLRVLRTTTVESFRSSRKFSKPKTPILFIAPRRQERKVRNRLFVGALCVFARDIPIVLVAALPRWASAVRISVTGLLSNVVIYASLSMTTGRFQEEYSLSIALSIDDENAGRWGEVEGRKRRNAEAMPGPNRWDKQQIGLAVVAPLK